MNLQRSGFFAGACHVLPLSTSSEKTSRSMRNTVSTCKALGLFFLWIFCNRVGREEEVFDDPNE